MQSLIELMWNKVEYYLKDSRKLAGQLEECFDSKGMQIELNGRNFKYNVLGGRFHMLPQSYKISHRLCLKYSLQVFLKGNQRYQVPPLRYINRSDKVPRLVRAKKVIGDMKYLMRSVKRSVEAVAIWTEDNWDTERVNSLYNMDMGGSI